MMNVVVPRVLSDVCGGEVCCLELHMWKVGSLCRWPEIVGAMSVWDI